MPFRIMVWLLLAVSLRLAAERPSGLLLPDGSEFVPWEKPLQFARTYYVDNGNPRSSDSNAGTADAPFLTINHAARVLLPGERVVIATGVYRESIVPARGGIGPEAMISYEAAPGATVTVKGSRLVKAGWQPSSGFSRGSKAAKSALYQFRMEQLDLAGYNPFGLLNVPKDRTYEELGKAPQGLRPILMTRGMVFADEKPLRQADTYEELSEVPGTFWPEQDGMVVHIHLIDGSDPTRHEIEFVTQEHVFAPRERNLGYIRIKGIIFEQGAGGFPRPQVGMVSTNRGHHWIIEDNTFRHANAVALDIGNQASWDRSAPEIGHMVVRRNHIYDAGICGIAGPEMRGTLIEDNLIEDIGWQDAESVWESAGIKLHVLRDSVLRRNVLRHIKHAAGIWLDWNNINNRVTENVIGDIETLNGGIFVEASFQPNMVDHNIVFDVRDAPIGREKGIQKEGGNCVITAATDETIIAHNLLARCRQSAVSVITEDWRLVMGRSGTGRNNKVWSNIFIANGGSIEFGNEHNAAEGNVYARTETGEQSEGGDLNWVTTHEHLKLDLAAWQKFFGFDKEGSAVRGHIDVDLDKLKMTWSISGRIRETPAEPPFEHDFNGEAASSRRAPGPFLKIPDGQETIGIDPRKTDSLAD